MDLDQTLLADSWRELEELEVSMHSLSAYAMDSLC